MNRLLLMSVLNSIRDKVRGYVLHLLVAAMFFCFPHSIQARQSAADTGNGPVLRVTGSVSDQTGALLPRTLVEIFDESGTLVASCQTDSRGEFAFPLPKGLYRVTATLAGFLPLRDQHMAVTNGMTPVHFTLEIPSMQQQIVVTATRTEAPVPQVGSSVTVISGRQLSREGIITIADALRRVAGVSLVQSGGTGQITSLFMRGGGSSYTRVMIDGITVNEPGGTFNLANLSMSSIDRIEIVRGPQSALFGSDAVAGVVQIFTRRGTSEGLSPAPGVSIEGGTFSTFRYGGQIQGKGDRMDYLASFTRLDTDNDVANGSFNETTFAGNVGFVPSSNTRLRAIFRSEAGRTGVPGSWAFQRPDLDSHFNRRDLSGGLTFTHYATPIWSQKISYTVNDSHQLSSNPIDSGSYVPEFEGRKATSTFYDFVYQNLNDTRRQRLNYQSDISLPLGHILTAGADYERESGIVGDPDLDPVIARRNNYGAYVQDQWTWRNRLFAAAGVRMEHNTSFGFFAAPRVSLAFHAHQPSPGSIWGLTKIKGNFGIGIKEPTLVESFSNSPYFRGNPDLLPEKSRSFDAGIEQYFGSGRTMLEATYFESHFRDQVGFAITDYASYEGSYFNIGKTRARGLETALRSELVWNLEVSGAYTFTDGEVIESTSPFDPVFAKGQELFRRPRHTGYVDLRWKPGRWTLGATGIFVGRRVDSDFSLLDMRSNPGYGILNLVAVFRIAGHFDVYTAVDNALNKEYMEVLGFPALRARFRVGLRAGL